MKAKRNIPEALEPPKPVLASKSPEPVVENKLPDPPYVPEDLPSVLPGISQQELRAYVNARTCLLVARADYEQKRAVITLKLLQLCLPEPGTYIARLENDGERLVVLEHCFCCHSSNDSTSQCAHCHTWAE